MLVGVLSLCVVHYHLEAGAFQKVKHLVGVLSFYLWYKACSTIEPSIILGALTSP